MAVCEKRFVPLDPVTPTVLDDIGDLHRYEPCLLPVVAPPGGAVEGPSQ
jgi:hypothetical protein